MTVDPRPATKENPLMTNLSFIVTYVAARLADTRRDERGLTTT